MNNHLLRNRSHVPLNVEKFNLCPVANDDEKVATASVESVSLGETKITSRYGRHGELLIMIGFWLRLAPEIQKLVASIFCDSKACACYTIQVKLQCGECAYAVGSLLNEYLVNESGQGGHNGIYIEFGNNFEGRRDIGPDWPGFEMPAKKANGHDEAVR